MTEDEAFRRPDTEGKKCGQKKSKKKQHRIENVTFNLHRIYIWMKYSKRRKRKEKKNFGQTFTLRMMSHGDDFTLPTSETTNMPENTSQNPTTQLFLYANALLIFLANIHLMDSSCTPPPPPSKKCLSISETISFPFFLFPSAHNEVLIVANE